MVFFIEILFSHSLYNLGFCVIRIYENLIIRQNVAELIQTDSKRVILIANEGSLECNKLNKNNRLFPRLGRIRMMDNRFELV